MYQYLTYLPNKFDKSEEYPLLIFLHGAPQRGDDLNLLKESALPYELEHHNFNLPMIVVAPQCPYAESWQAHSLYEFFVHIYKTYRIDLKRVYLTGFSMGGFGAIRFAGEYNKMFAAVAPVCSGGTTLYAEKLKNIPFWFFHGDQDKIIEIEKTQELVNSLTNLNADVKFTVYEGVGHDAWTRTYKNQELYTWFLSHHL